jgi:hypothetical protein
MYGLVTQMYVLVTDVWACHRCMGLSQMYGLVKRQIGKWARKASKETNRRTELTSGG